MLRTANGWKCSGRSDSAGAADRHEEKIRRAAERQMAEERRKDATSETAICVSSCGEETAMCSPSVGVEMAICESSGGEEMAICESSGGEETAICESSGRVEMTIERLRALQ